MLECSRTWKSRCSEFERNQQRNEGAMSTFCPFFLIFFQFQKIYFFTLEYIQKLHKINWNQSRCGLEKKSCLLAVANFSTLPPNQSINQSIIKSFNQSINQSTSYSINHSFYSLNIQRTNHTWAWASSWELFVELHGRSKFRESPKNEINSISERL